MTTTQAGHVIIVEDEQAIAEILRDYLHKGGFRTTCVADGAQAVSTVKKDPPDVILLDLMLPGKDGMAICREIRAFSTVPIIMVTAKAEEIDILLGLEIGADDFICKPFSPREVVARVKAQYRRSLYAAKPKSKCIFEVNEAQSCITLNGERLDLTPTEYRILKLFVSHPSRVYSRSQLLDLCYQSEQLIVDRVIDSHIKNLRRKLEKAWPGHEVIHAVYGIGYRFEFEEQSRD